MHCGRASGGLFRLRFELIYGINHHYLSIANPRDHALTKRQAAELQSRDRGVRAFCLGKMYFAWPVAKCILPNLWLAKSMFCQPEARDSYLGDATTARNVELSCNVTMYHTIIRNPQTDDTHHGVKIA